MHKGFLVYVIVIIVMIVGAYIYTGFKFLPFISQHKTTVPTVSTTIKLSTTTTENTTTTINYTNFVSPCQGLTIASYELNRTYTSECSSNGGKYGLWVASGNAGTESATITGSDGKVYVNQTSSYDCITFYQNFTLPAQVYTVTYKTGPGGGSCGNSVLVINGTTAPPIIAYPTVYNGNFGNGQYTGWTVTDPGFGTAPLNIPTANSKLCYSGRPWSNYNGTNFATTYNCGITSAAGNITSSPFMVDPAKPFLNFKLISPEDNNLYVVLLRANYKIVDGKQVYTNSTPLEIAHFNTFNLSANPYSLSTFANVTLPLTLYVNQPLQIRIVSAVSGGSDFIAVGGFYLSKRPQQDGWVAENVTFIGS